MSDSILREGGPNNIRRVGPDQYEMSVSLPTDKNKMTGRECPQQNCSPAYFKVKAGTGITEDYNQAFCPYCRFVAEPSEFHTKAQREYAINLMKHELIGGVHRQFGKALGFGPLGGRKKFSGGLVEMSYKPSRLPPVVRPLEEELRRDITCVHCTLEHSVFGLATWCPDCGADIFLVHVAQEFEVIKNMLSEVEARRNRLGSRVAARDVENALEDTVSVFEAVLKALVTRALAKRDVPLEGIKQLLEREVRSAFQNIRRAADVFAKLIGVQLLAGCSEEDIIFLSNVFEKRHPITHNLGIVDRKYLERVMSGELEGREVRVTVEEIQRATCLCERVISSAHAELFS